MNSKNLLVKIFFVIFLLILSTSAYAYTLSGTIKDSDTKLPLSNAVVSIYDLSNNLIISSAPTAADGLYTIDAGSTIAWYFAKSTKTGYTEQSNLFYNNQNRINYNFEMKSTSAPSCTDADGDSYYIEGGACGTIDCNDGDNTINPGATEICDGKNNDCNAGTADGSGQIAPLNSLQFGVCLNSVKVCNGALGWQDSYVGIINYQATETSCDSLDNDCDNIIDEGVKITYYRDVDSDSFGNLLSTIQACALPVGYVINSQDCDDTNFNIKPSSANPCLDCNSATACLTCSDIDLDGYGVGDTTPCTYTQIDCNDNNNLINAGIAEICGNGIDENCDGVDDTCPPSGGGGGGGGGGSSSGCGINLRELAGTQTFTTRNSCVVSFTYNGARYETNVVKVTSNDLTLSLLNNQAVALLNKENRLSLTADKDLIFTYNKLDFGVITMTFRIGDKLKPTTVTTTSTTQPTTQTTTETISETTENQGSSTPTGAVVVSGLRKNAVGIGIMLAIILVGSVVYYVFSRKEY